MKYSSSSSYHVFTYFQNDLGSHDNFQHKIFREHFTQQIKFTGLFETKLGITPNRLHKISPSNLSPVNYRVWKKTCKNVSAKFKHDFWTWLEWFGVVECTAVWFGCVLQPGRGDNSVVCGGAHRLALREHLADICRHQVPVYEEVSIHFYCYFFQQCIRYW